MDMDKELKLAITGALTDGSAEEQKRRLLDRLGPNLSYLEVDLSGVTDIDRHGLQVLLEVYKEVKQRRANFNLVGVSDQIKQLVAAEQLDDVLPIEVPQSNENPTTPAVTPRPAVRPQVQAPARASALKWLIPLILALAVVVVLQQVFFNGPGIPPPNDQAKARFATGNAHMVASLLLEYAHQHKHFPARAVDVQTLVDHRRLSLMNQYDAGKPLAIHGKGEGGPGDLVYTVSHGHFKIEILGPDGQLLNNDSGKPVLITDSAR